MVLYCELCNKGIYGKVLEYPRDKEARLEDAFNGCGLPPDEALVAILGKGKEAQNRDGSARKQPSNRICNGPRPNERNCSERCATVWKLWRPQVCGPSARRALTRTSTVPSSVCLSPCVLGPGLCCWWVGCLRSQAQEGWMCAKSI